MRFHPMRKYELLDRIFHAACSRERMIVAGANLHGLYVAHVDQEYRGLVERPETITIVDGMPVVWLLNALGYSVGRNVRTTWVDWFGDLLSGAADKGLSVFVLGHDAEVLSTGLNAARRLHPDLRIDGRPGFFDMEDPASVDAVIDEINGYAPDILIVGMGMPRQERFVERFGRRLAAPVIGLGGAAFAYFAGYEPTPPRWMGRWGLEWLHRLCMDPRRMAWRYMVEPALLACFLLKATVADQPFRRRRAYPQQ
jgi:N-acetylglucosaminyldiphosphoundecaprenol N-acetyl-beta-D-mannosaminyltransferase